MKKQQVETGPAVGEIWKSKNVKRLRAHVRRIVGKHVYYVPFDKGRLSLEDDWEMEDTLKGFMNRYRPVRR